MIHSDSNVAERFPAWDPRSPLVIETVQGGIAAHLSGDSTLEDISARVVGTFPTLIAAEDTTIRALGALDLVSEDKARALQKALGPLFAHPAHARELHLWQTTNSAVYKLSRVLVRGPAPCSDESWRLPLELMPLVVPIKPKHVSGEQPLGELHACLGDRDDLLLVRGPSSNAHGPQLALVDALRLLVVIMEGEMSWPFRDLQQDKGLRGHVTILTCPSWSEVNKALKDGMGGSPFNAIAFVGHIEPYCGLFVGPASSTGGRYSRDHADPVEPERLGAMLESHSETLRVIILGGCGSWREFGEAVAKTRIAAFIGQHAKVDPESQIQGIHAFASEMVTGSGSIDEAFIRYRNAASKDRPWMKGSSGLFLRGFNTQLIARSPTTLARLRYLNALRTATLRIELPGQTTGKSRLEGGYVDRELTIEVAEKKPAHPGDRPGGFAGGRQGVEGERDVTERRLKEQRIHTLMTSEKNVRLGLRAPAGTGKSALLQAVTFDLARNSLQTTVGVIALDSKTVDRNGLPIQFSRRESEHEVTTSPVPIYVRLRAYTPSAVGAGGMRTLLTASVRDLFVRSSLSPSIDPDLTTLLSRTDVALLADGVDEVPTAFMDPLKTEISGLEHHIQDLFSGASLFGVLIATRPEAAAKIGEPYFPNDATTEREKSESERRVFDLAPWSLEEVQRYVEGFFGTDPAGKRLPVTLRLLDHIQHKGLNEAASYPFTLWMLCQEASSAGPNDPLSETETEIIHNGIERVLQRRSQEIPVDYHGRGTRLLKSACLPAIAELLFERRLRGSRLRFDDAVAIVRHHFSCSNSTTRIPGAPPRPQTLLDRRCRSAGELSLDIGPDGMPDEASTMTLLEHWIQHSGLLVKVDTGVSVEVSDSDLRFEEFLLAYHLNELLEIYGWHGRDQVSVV